MVLQALCNEMEVTETLEEHPEKQPSADNFPTKAVPFSYSQGNSVILVDPSGREFLLNMSVEDLRDLVKSSLMAQEQEMIHVTTPPETEDLPALFPTSEEGE